MYDMKKYELEVNGKHLSKESTKVPRVPPVAKSPTVLSA